ncbi:type IV secretion system protein [Rugamonas sp. A1-17]|nr:type IV secretion system protein [Rugamonas sp. A1-17]
MSFLSKTILTILLCVVQMATNASAQDRFDAAAMNAAVAAEQKDKADHPPQRPPGGMFLGLTGIIKQLSGKSAGSLADTLFGKGLEVARKSVVWAKGLGASLALLYFVVEGIAFMTGKNSSLKASMVEVAVPVAFCSYLLFHYDTLIAEFCGQHGLLSYVREMGGDPVDGFLTFYGQILSAVVKSIGNAGTNYLSTWSIAHPLDTVTALAELIITILFSLGVAIVALMGLAEMLGLVLIGPFLTAIGVALGPIFIACIVTPWTREYFTRWIGFVVSASLLTAIIGICINIAISLFDFYHFDRYTNQDEPTAMTMLLLLIILTTVNSLISQAPGIASALVPGSTGASKGGGGGLAGAGKALAKRAGNTAGGVKKLISKSAGKAE